MPRRGASFRFVMAALLAVGCGFAACGEARSRAGRASDTWRRTYGLEPGGELQIVDAVGSIEVQAGPGDSLEVEADRVVRAQNTAIAASLIERVRIAEEVSPARVLLRNDALGGILNADVEVNFRVRVPASAGVRLRTASGGITLTGLAGAVVASVQDGSIRAAELRGPVDARTGNGDLSVAMADIGEGPVTLRATRGDITLLMPRDAGADVRISASRGLATVEGFTVASSVQGASTHVEGRLGSGGPRIDLSTTEGNILLRPTP